tara:strand:- start:3666 stop:4208 length:543 start_codon:yes stop_codon:yes gene_type:complete
MGLNINGLKSSSNFSSTPKTNGIFVSRSKVSGVKVFYNEQQKWQKKPDSIGVEMTLDIGKDFEPTFYVGGQFSMDEFGDRVGIGTVKKVDILLTSLGIDTELSDDGKIPEEAVEEFVGKEFTRLSYVSGIKDNGKSKWSEWQETAEAGVDFNILIDKFLLAVEKGYVKNYKPEQPDDLAL